VGGDAPARLLDLLSEGGALVSYASATGQPMSVDVHTLIGKRATVHGFFAGRFDYATKVLPVIREAAPLAAGSVGPGLVTGHAGSAFRCPIPDRYVQRMPNWTSRVELLVFCLNEGVGFSPHLISKWQVLAYLAISAGREPCTGNLVSLRARVLTAPVTVVCE
jgi:hypothetical protein